MTNKSNKAKQSDAPDEALSFEKAMAEIETIIDRVESGEMGLEESIDQYANGMTLIQTCRTLLGRAEIRIQQLTTDEAGQAVVDETSETS